VPVLDLTRKSNEDGPPEGVDFADGGFGDIGFEVGFGEDDQLRSRRSSMVLLYFTLLL
jgi:hypothetical protein